jgi:hypothetical protein
VTCVQWPSSEAGLARGGVSPRARRTSPEGSFDPRARRTSPEGVFSPRGRWASPEGAFSYAALAGRRGHQGCERLVRVF